MLSTPLDLALLYPWLKLLHQSLVTASVALFAVRGMAVLGQAQWPRHPRVRLASVLIDSALLLAGIGLWGVLGFPLTGHAWLATKWALLPVYVVLGAWALGRARTRALRALCLVLALATVGQMAAVALTKHPAGFFSGYFISI